MRSHGQLIAYHLRSLTRFSGRDARPVFWPWAITLVVAAMAAMSAAMIPIMIRMTSLVRQNPGQSRVPAGPGSYKVELEPGVPGVSSSMTMFVIAVAIIAAILVPLLAASVARRLHDRGRSGAWGLLPLPFLASGLFLMSWMFGSKGTGGPPDGLFLAGFLNNLIYLASLAYLVVLLIRDGNPGDNRYGSPPA